eukprot:jgi/Hompol1/838/HPOL_004379-RA
MKAILLGDTRLIANLLSTQSEYQKIAARVHFWMFLSDSVSAKERMDNTGSKQLLWAHLSRDASNDQYAVDTKYEHLCR